jgi:hypothetical protein
MKKNNNMNTISGNDAVEIAGTSPVAFFLNLDIFLKFNINFFLAQPQKVFVETKLEYL